MAWKVCEELENYTAVGRWTGGQEVADRKCWTGNGGQEVADTNEYSKASTEPAVSSYYLKLLKHVGWDP